MAWFAVVFRINTTSKAGSIAQGALQLNPSNCITSATLFPNTTATKLSRINVIAL